MDEITITHPDVKATSTVSRAAFEGCWKDLGWKEVNPPSTAKPATTTPRSAGSQE